MRYTNKRIVPMVAARTVAALVRRNKVALDDDFDAIDIDDLHTFRLIEICRINRSHRKDTSM